ncbi:TPA: hypothetical protein N0F65_008763 [Lagenidium giganteum]|uniref:Letm1 RBD domain-containing protein n=1 Tax=Lagenidium giganteum TaxID=4803 RepID=A0AAV2Z2G8_9STRA|nr:TPA: hypothetical protein N0F65_008763 [Lagenidium giganteum]
MRALAMQRMAMGFLAHQQGTLTSVILTSTKVPHTCRSFSSGMTKSDDDNGPRKELSPYQQLQKWLQPFVQGSRAMYHENKQAWHVRAKLKQHQQTATTGVSAVLTRQEMMILRQAHRDLLKALPLLAFFCVPLVGYAAPVIGYAFPKQLLPWQFWRPDQKTQFFSEDAQAKAAHYPELRKLLLQMDRKQHNVEEMLARNGHEGLNPAEVGELVPFFDRNGPAFLDTLPRHHLHVLSQSIALMPAFSWLVRLFPKNMVQQYLERRADELRVDDLMLLREGIDGLSLSELEFACEERGIVTGYGNIDALRGALREWLSMYDTDHVDAAAPQCFPSSLLLHAPALGRFSNAQIDTK